MKKQFWIITVVLLLLTVFLSACDSKTEQSLADTSIPAESVAIATTGTAEPTEVEIKLDPQWLDETAIDEAYACLFPVEGKINIEQAQEILAPLVEAGNAEAEYYWGYIYDWYIPDNTGECEAESLYWYKRSAEQGYAKAYLAAALNDSVESQAQLSQFLEGAKQAGIFKMTPEDLGADGCLLLGLYYVDKKDYTTSIEWITNSSKMGSSSAKIALAFAYYNSNVVEQDYVLAADLTLEAAQLGDILGMYWYGWMLSDDDVATELISQRYGASLHELLDSANAGDPLALYKIGVMYDFGYGEFDVNKATALEWYLKAAEAGHPYATYIIGEKYYSGDGLQQDFELAFEWFQKAADAGNHNAMYSIGNMYYWGEYVEANNQIGDDWYKRADEVRYSTPEEELYSDKGELLKTAMEWHEKAADAGLADSMIELAYYSDVGKGEYFNNHYGGCTFGVDYREVETWYLKAADTGSSNAMHKLACFYESYEQYDIAMESFIKAHANGYDSMEQIMELLSNKQGVNAYFENYGELILSEP